MEKSQNFKAELHPFKNYITKTERVVVSTHSLHGTNRVKFYQILQEHLFRRKDKCCAMAPNRITGKRRSSNLIFCGDT